MPGAIDGGRFWWVAPTLTQMRASDIWTDLKRACRNAARPKHGGKISEVDKEIRLENGAQITVKSADSGVSLRGAGLTGLIVDEFPFLPEKTWLDELRPSLSDTGGWAMLIGTPKGRNWAYNLFQDCPNRVGWEAWQLPTRMNPLIPPEELEEARRDLGPRRYSQEYEALFTDIENAVFPGFYFESIYADRWPESFEVTSLYCDPSLGKEAKTGDYQAIVYAGLCGGLIWVDAWLVKVPPMQLVEMYAALYHQLQPTWAGMEANGFQSLLQNLMQAHCRQSGLAPIPIVPIINTVKKATRVSALDPWLAPLPGTSAGRVRIRPTEGGRKLVEQLMMFPDTAFHDDGPDALEGAIRLFYRGHQEQQDHESEVEIAWT